MTDAPGIGRPMTSSTMPDARAEAEVAREQGRALPQPVRPQRPHPVEHRPGRCQFAPHLALRGPVANGKSPVVMHTVTSIPIPAGATTQLIPNSYHLLITGAAAMHDGKDIQLTLKFAHAAPITVYALVTDPQNGGSSYFLN